MSSFINLGIVAHVDAGKTSITEFFLFKSGLTRTLGSVDKGSSHTDWLEVEKQRGISVRAATVSIKWKNININIIDTPGHADFSSEVERSLLAMDAAILVVSGVEGIQSHTIALWDALRKIKIPTIIFINKLDRAGANSSLVFKELISELRGNFVQFQQIENEESAELIVNRRSFKNESFVEEILDGDESLMEKYLEGNELLNEELSTSLQKQIENCMVFPVFTGSAKYDIGIDELLDAVTTILPTAKIDETKALSGIVYKVEQHKTLGKVASVRLFSGSLKNRDTVFMASQNKEGKISQIRKLLGQKFEDVGELHAGDSAAICGLSEIRAGDIIGQPLVGQEEIRLNTSLLTVKVSTPKSSDYSELVRVLHILSDEDPALDLLWLKDERELHIKIMGLIQVEILQQIIRDRFSLEVEFGKPTVIYRETPKGDGFGYEEYTMPKPCWAVIKFKIEAGERGSGVHYKSLVGVNQIEARYQKEIERTIPKALKQGILGWEVTDLKITLVDGEHHNIHSRAGDFAVATLMALLNGLKSIGTKLLEPVLDFKITAPEQTLGKVAGNLTMLRAEFANPEISDGKFTLSGTIPLSTSLDFPAKLNTITAGKGRLIKRFSAYRECELEYGETTPYRGISPLDRAKWILKARKAIQ